MLDTDIFSNFILAERNYPALRRKILQTAADQICISVVMVEELLKLLLNNIQRNWDKPDIVSRNADFQDFLNQVSQLQCLPFDEAAYQQFLKIPHASRKRHPRDCRLAAIALSRGCIVVTRNTRHFENIPDVVCEDWMIVVLHDEPGGQL